MAHFTLFLVRVLPVLWMMCTPTKSIEIKGQLPPISEIRRFINYIKPYLQSMFPTTPHRPLPNFDKPVRNIDRPVPNIEHFRRSDKTVEAAIRERISELTGLLQDEDGKARAVDNTLKSNEDTTIIEFVPNHDDQTVGKVPQKKVKKYKKVRNHIKRMLHNEAVSNDTKTLVLNTLDNILELLVKNQCTSNPMKALRSGRTNNTLSKLYDLSIDKKRKQTYEPVFKNNILEKMEILKIIEDYFSNVIDGARNSTGRYRIHCQLINVETQRGPSKLRANSTRGNLNKYCETFKLCSVELKDFLTDFYKNINETTVILFRNYGAMYIRDVEMNIATATDNVVSTINKVGDTVERKVTKSFIKQLKNLRLDDKKNEAANIKHLSEYVNTTVADVKARVRKRIEKDLVELQTRLYLTVKDDLNGNLDADLNNLEQLFMKKMCNHFVKCNGKDSARRTDETQARKRDKSIYVKVQVTVDDDFKPNNDLETKRRNQIDVKYNNIKVTRTTSFNSIVSNSTKK